MEIIKLKIDEVIPYENNPRNNDEAVAYVAESIKQCGYCSPIIIDEDNVILCGHTRLKALKQLGYKEVECVRKSGMTDEQKKKYRILDNKTAEVAEWNFDLLEAELKDLDFGDFDFGFDDMPELSEPAEITEDEVPEVDDKSEPITKPGDIWQNPNDTCRTYRKNPLRGNTERLRYRRHIWRNRQGTGINLQKQMMHGGVSYNACNHDFVWRNTCLLCCLQG